MDEAVTGQAVPADATAVAEQGALVAQEAKKRTRKPRAPKPPKKARVAGVLRILKDEGDGKWSDMEIDAGSDLQSAGKVLRTLASGRYQIVRSYGTKTVKIETVPKVTVM
jgi:hypothetical protein